MKLVKKLSSENKTLNEFQNESMVVLSLIICISLIYYGVYSDNIGFHLAFLCLVLLGWILLGDVKYKFYYVEEK